MIKISDFAGRDGTLDVSRLMELSDGEFTSALLEESRLYMKNHGHFPRCAECMVQVMKSENLVRYFGTNMHDSCFVRVYEKEREGHHLTDRERTYFDRVLKVVKNRNKKEFDF